MQPGFPTPLFQAFAVAFTVALAACAMPDYPEDGDFTHYQNTYRSRAAEEFAALERQRDSGSLSADQYASAIRQLEARITAQAHDAIFRHHELSGERAADPNAGVSGSVSGASGGGR